jgi:pyocin large subunit-like protein
MDGFIDDATKGAGNYTGKPYSGTRNADVDFSNAKGRSTLKTHFYDHAGDFGYKTEAEYLSGTRNFLEKPPTPTTQSFITKDGTYFRYDTATNEFGIMNKYGGSSTYFKPDRGIDYWLEQIELYAPKK